MALSNVRRMPVNPKDIDEKYEKIDFANTWSKPEIRNNNKDKWCLRQFSCMHSSRSNELTVYKVSHGYLQHHHHHWRHHHRRHHNQHDVHQLFQSNSILRVPKTRSPPHAMPSFSSWDGLPLEDFRWLQLNAKVIRRRSLYFYSLSSFASTSFSMIIDSSHCFCRRHAPPGCLHCTTDHPVLQVVTTLPR